MGLNYQKRNRIFSLFFVLAAILMATLLLKNSSGFLPYLQLAVPYTFLLGLWICFYRVNQHSSKVESALTEEGRPAFRGLQESISLQTYFGLVGIAIALAIGWSMGSLATHTVRRRANDSSLVAVRQLIQISSIKPVPVQTSAAIGE